MQSDHATACAGELGPVKQNQVTIEKANPAHGITHDHQLLCAHRGRDQLSVEVDLILDVVIGWTGEFAVRHTRKADLRGQYG